MMKRKAKKKAEAQDMEQDIKQQNQPTEASDQAENVAAKATENEIPIESEAKEGEDDSIEVEAKPSKKDASQIESLQMELEKTRAALAEAEAYNLRLNADFINFRKRKEKEMADVVRFANQDLLKQILPVLDNFDRSLEAMEKSDNLTALKEGIAGVDRNMKNILGKIGLEPIQSVGEEFDSEIHEAITTMPVEDEAQKGKVIEEIEKGYRLKDKIIRFSKVIVGE